MCNFFILMIGGQPRSTLFPCTTRFRSHQGEVVRLLGRANVLLGDRVDVPLEVAGERLLVEDTVGVGLAPDEPRSEEHTSELQSRQYLVCRLLLEKKQHNMPSEHVLIAV